MVRFCGSVTRPVRVARNSCAPVMAVTRKKAHTAQHARHNIVTSCRRQGFRKLVSPGWFSMRKNGELTSPEYRRSRAAFHRDRENVSDIGVFPQSGGSWILRRVLPASHALWVTFRAVSHVDQDNAINYIYTFERQYRAEKQRANENTVRSHLLPSDRLYPPLACATGLEQCAWTEATPITKR